MSGEEPIGGHRPITHEDRIEVKLTTGPYDAEFCNPHELMVQIYIPLWVVMNHNAEGLGSHIAEKIDRLLTGPRE